MRKTSTPKPGKVGLVPVKLTKEQRRTVGRSQVDDSRGVLTRLRQHRREAAVKSRTEFVGVRRPR